eukprot:1309517-Pyramimonas_sp.AAC.1
MIFSARAHPPLDTTCHLPPCSSSSTSGTFHKLLSGSSTATPVDTTGSTPGDTTISAIGSDFAVSAVG